VDREGLWFNVLCSRYGEVRGHIKEGGGMVLPSGGR